MRNVLSNLTWNQTRLLPWIILAFATLNEIFLGGARRAFGSFIARLRIDFRNVTLTELNWVGDSYASMGYILSGVSTAMILYTNKRYRITQSAGAALIFLSFMLSSLVPNPHWLFLSHSLINGIGSSIILANIGLLITEHFELEHPYHLLATTLVSGGSMGTILFVPFFAYIIDMYGWRLSFAILAFLYFIGTGSAAIFYQKTEVKNFSNSFTLSCSSNEIGYKQVPLLVLWFVDRILTSAVTYGLVLNLTDYVHRGQSDLVKSTILTTLFAAGEASTYIIGAIITATTKDFLREKLRYILLVSSVCMGASLIALEFAKHIHSAAKVLCLIIGFTMGPSNAFLFAAGEELTLLPGHMAYPFSLAGMGVGMILSPLMTAKIAEIFRYKWFFLVQGCLIFVKSSCLLSISILLFFYKNTSKRKDSMSTTFSDNILEWPDNPDETTELIRDRKTD